MKSITKKILSIIVILLLSITLLPMSAMADYSSDFEYEVDDDGNAMITDYYGSGGAVTIPATLDGYPVIAIDDGAFYNNNDIISVTFNGSINTIGTGAFQYCDGLTSVTFQGDVGTIGKMAFYICKNLSTLTFKGNVETIGEMAFYVCSALKDIYFNGTETEWNAVTKEEAWNAGCPEDMEIHFSEYTVEVSVSPEGGGSVTGAGTYDTGTTAKVTATPSHGYSFVNWTENGNVASTNANYSFTVDKKHSLVANFKPTNYEITVVANDNNGGTVSGGGTYAYDKTTTLTATPKAGYVFERWTVDTDSSWTSHSPEISIKVDGNQTYTALFWEVSIGDIDPQEYTGGQIRPTGLKVELIGVDVKLTDEDYGLSYGENVDAGKDAGTVTVAFKDKFTGQVTKKFDITRKSLSISLGASDITYGADETLSVTGFPTDATGTVKFTVNGKEYVADVSNGKAELTLPSLDADSYTVAATYSGDNNHNTATADTTFTVSQATPKPQTPSGLTAVYGQTLADVTLPEVTGGTWTWQDAATTSVGNVGEQVFKATFTPTDTKNFTTVKDVEVTVTVLEKKVYSFETGAEGKWKSGSTTALEFVVKANRDDDKTIENFVGIEVDGNTVEKEASGKANWIATKGSVIIDLQPDYLKTLAAGEHTLTVLFDDPYTVDTTFTIEAAQEETKPADTSPKTGDNNHLTLWVVLMAAALAGGISILILALKRRKQ